MPLVYTNKIIQGCFLKMLCFGAFPNQKTHSRVNLLQFLRSAINLDLHKSSSQTTISPLIFFQDNLGKFPVYSITVICLNDWGSKGYKF